MIYQLVQAGFWLALSTWFGGAVFVAVTASVVFRTLREQNPVLPQVLSVNLEGQHGTLLGSTIMSSVLASMGRVQLVCAAVTLMALGSHFAITDTTGQNLTAAVVRVVLAALAAGVFAYDRYVVFPRLSRNRQSYLDHADEPDAANPARDAFDKDQQLSLTLLMVLTCLLAGLIFFSAPITPAPTSVPLRVTQ